MLAGLVVLASGCVSVPERNPLPEDLVANATVPGGEYARYWGDEAPPYTDAWFDLSKEELLDHYPAIIGRPHTYLALSGGGERGAFGAGVLCGWTASGTRPEFTIVTGISTGALTAPFAFLGSDYDHYIREGYTTVTAKDIFKERSKLNAVSADAAANNQPLIELVDMLVTEEMMAAIAAEHGKGRSLIIGTMNLDSDRPVHWNIGEIASSGDSGALDLIRDVLVASAAVPGAFPPVLLEVEADGRRYDEMHVDGGVGHQVFTYPAGLDWEEVLERLEVPGVPKLYIIRNAILKPDFRIVKNKTLNIGLRSASAMIRSQGIANLHEIYLKAKRDGVDYNLAYIPDSFDVEEEEPFDPVYMKALFDLGFEMAKEGYPWHKAPPDYNLEAESR
jgi:hypothetical protein